MNNVNYRTLDGYTVTREGGPGGSSRIVCEAPKVDVRINRDFDEYSVRVNHYQAVFGHGKRLYAWMVNNETNRGVLYMHQGYYSSEIINFHMNFVIFRFKTEGSLNDGPNPRLRAYRFAHYIAYSITKKQVFHYDPFRMLKGRIPGDTITDEAARNMDNMPAEPTMGQALYHLYIEEESV